MSDDETGDGVVEAPAKQRRKPSGRRPAAESSKDGLADVHELHPTQVENLAKGHAANKARGEVPRDPDYVSRREQFLAGTLKVEDLDDEELEKLQFKDRHGRMTGRPAKLTTAQTRSLQAEWRKRIARRFEEQVTTAMQVLNQVMNSKAARDSDRLRAAELVMGRALGKETQTVQSVNIPWEEFQEGTVVEIDRDVV